jgi:nicotinate dehydrogenase subunit A
MISFMVNGKKQSVDVDPDTPLLYVLRNDLGLNGPKFGCGLAQCGACTVIMDGVAILSCETPVSRAAGRTILTLEGLGSMDQAIRSEGVHRGAGCAMRLLRERYDHEEQGLRPRREPTERDIRKAMAVCRCGTHNSIIRAVNAQQEMRP